MMPSQPVNVPIEVVRSLIAVAELGSISKAAESVGLSQPAVSAQIKRVEALVSGPIFDKSAGGSTLTHLGRLALEQARRIIDTNDQFLRLGGQDQPSSCRFGVAQVLAPSLFKACPHDGSIDLFLISEQCSSIRKGLFDGYIDMALIFLPEVSEIDDQILIEAPSPMSWFCAKDFVWVPDRPLPLVSLTHDEWLIKPLERSGISYRITVRSSDHNLRMDAVRAGLGIMATPTAHIPQDLMEAHNEFLPKLPAMKLALCARPDMNSRHKTMISSQIRSRFFS